MPDRPQPPTSEERLEEAEDAALAKLARRGVRLLLGRQAAMQVLGLGAGIVLARLLGPAEFGAYAIVTFAVGVLSAAGDLGIAPAMVQRRDEPTDLQLQVAVTLQLILATAAVAVTWMLSGWIARLFPVTSRDTALQMDVFALTLYGAAFRSVGVARLERSLTYAPVARCEVAETAIFHLTSVGLALCGARCWSFVAAAIARAILGPVLLFLSAPWPFRPRLEAREACALLRDGIPFQCGILLNALGGWATPAVVGGVAGAEAVGLLGNASANANRPLLFVEAIMRISFPHFSRLQADETRLRATVARYLASLVAFTSLWAAVIWGVGPCMIEVVYSAKWLPAAPAMAVFAAALPFEMVFWTTGYAYASVGRFGAVARVNGVRACATLALAAVLVPRIGLMSVPWATLLSAAGGAAWLLATFAEGFALQILRSVAWVAPCAFGAALAGQAAIHAGRGAGLSSAACLVLGLSAVLAVGAGAARVFLPGILRHKAAPQRLAACRPASEASCG